MKINKKQLGSSVRRGALVGTFGGFLAGWLAFAAHAVELPAVDVSAEIQYEAPAPVPAMPTLRTVAPQTAAPDPTADPTSGLSGQAGQPGQAAAPATLGTSPKVVTPAAGAPALAAPVVKAPVVGQPVVPPAPAPVFVPAPPVPKTVVKPPPVTAPSKKP